MSSQPTSAPTGARARMVSGAAELFRERGVAGTALADIVAHSHAPRGSLYHYFPGGKAQLAEEATAMAGRELGSALTALLATEKPASAVRLMIDVFRKRLVDSEFVAGCPVAAGALEGGEAPGARHAAGEAFTSWESTISSVLWQHGVQADRADRLATLMVSTIEGALIVAKAQRSTRALDRAEAELVDLVSAVVNDEV